MSAVLSTLLRQITASVVSSPAGILLKLFQMSVGDKITGTFKSLPSLCIYLTISLSELSDFMSSN